MSLKPVSLEKDPIYLIWTSIKDEPLLVEHTNRSLLAQMFSPSGTSNHWLDQVIYLFLSSFYRRHLIDVWYFSKDFP